MNLSIRQVKRCVKFSPLEAAGSHVRGDDYRIRYGGEEFAIVLRNVGMEQALQIAEKLRAAVGATPVPIPEKDPLKLTISIGAAELKMIPSRRNHGEVTSQGALCNALKRADDALIEAKNAGRNRVMVSAK